MAAGLANGRSGLKAVVGIGMFAASMVVLPGVGESWTAKGLRCQYHASRMGRASILVGIERSLGHTPCERSWRLVSKMSM